MWGESGKDSESQTAKEKANVLVKGINEFEAFLLTQSGDIDLEQLGWKDKIMKMYQYAHEVWRQTGKESYQATSWWLGNIEKSYMRRYNVRIGLLNIQGAENNRGFKQWIQEELPTID